MSFTHTFEHSTQAFLHETTSVKALATVASSEMYATYDITTKTQFTSHPEPSQSGDVRKYAMLPRMTTSDYNVHASRPMSSESVFNGMVSSTAFLANFLQDILIPYLP